MLRRTALALACLSLALLSLAACGGSSGGDSGPKTYENSEYGFALTYPGAFERVDSKDTPIMQQMEFSTTFADPASADEAKAHDEVVDAAVVAVSRLPQTLTKAEVRDVLRKTAEQMQGMSGTDLGYGFNDVSVSLQPLTTFAGAPCLTYEMTYSNDAGALLHDRSYMFIKGDTYYAIQLTAAEDRWQQSSPTLQGIADSFRIL